MHNTLRAALVAAAFAACGSSAQAQSIPFWVMRGSAPPATPIQHVIVIVQENRTVDNFFNGFCVSVSQCANTVTTGKISTGATVTLQPAPAGIVTGWDPGHHHSDFVAACHGTTNSGTCLNDSFDLESCSGNATCTGAQPMAYYYTPSSYLIPYWYEATNNGVLSDETFQEQEGPSLDNHLYVLGSAAYLSPTSTSQLSENMTGGNPGCYTTGTSASIDMTQPFATATEAPYSGTGSYTGSGGCIDEPTITDLLDAQHLSWYFIQPKVYPNGDVGLWAAANNVQHICQGSIATDVCSGTEWANNVAQWASVGNNITALSEIIGRNELPAVTWIVPTENNSDHPNTTTNNGPDYVESLVSLIGNSSYWNSSIIIVEWDDWGGWYDHVTPPAPAWNAVNPYEYGFRVPVMVLSPYAKTGIVDHTIRGRQCVNKLIETIFGLGNISSKSIDQYCEDDFIGSSLNFAQPPNAFVN